MALEPTGEPDVFIEAQREGYIRYVRKSTGERWEVTGVCDHRGDCLVGSVIDGKLVKTKAQAKKLAKEYTGPDVPVLPGFKGCCPLKGKWLQ
jgi:hypothetical protein